MAESPDYQPRGAVPPPSPVTTAPEAGVSPGEVTVRTMATDIASMAGSGGGQPVVESVALPGAAGTAPGEAGPAVPSRRGPLLALWLIAGVGALGVLFLLGYYVIPFIFDRGLPAKTPLEAELPPAGAPPPEAAPVPSFVHESAFRLRPKGTFELQLGSVLIPADLETMRTQVAFLASTADASSSFFEIELKDSEGEPFSLTGLFSVLRLSVLEEMKIAGSFSPDFTFFIHRDEDGAWPGYVFALREGETPLLLQSRFARIEGHLTTIGNFFLTVPGSPQGEFSDIQLSGQPLRALAFERPGAAFTYGWFHGNYLIVSTSFDGLREALARL